MKDRIYGFRDFNLEALLRLSERLRGRACTCDASKFPTSGCTHWVVFVTFDDGVEWDFRAPRREFETIYSDETASKTVMSEAATLLYLKAHTQVPVANVYSYSGSSDNDIGVPYILQSKAEGRSLGSYDWSQLSKQVPGYHNFHPRLSISDENRAKVMRQLGSIAVELSRHTFDRIGSLFQDQNGDYSVGECLSPTLTWQDRDSLDLDRGPFDEEEDYLTSLISALTSHAKELSLTPHCFSAPVPDMVRYRSNTSYRAAVTRWNDFMKVGQKIDHSKNALSYCIVGQFLQEMVPRLSSGLKAHFPLSHPDLHLGNLYVDDDFNITCIIDWSSTSTGPITELLAIPCLGSSSIPTTRHLAACFEAGFTEQARSITLQLCLHDLWETSRKTWFFTRLVRLLSKNDYDHFRELYELVYKISTDETEESKALLRLLHERIMLGKNQNLVAELQKDDVSEDELKKEEQRSFPPGKARNTEAIAVARKLTLMSEMNENFFADHMLWQWVEDCTGDYCA